MCHLEDFRDWSGLIIVARQIILKTRQVNLKMTDKPLASAFRPTLKSVPYRGGTRWVGQYPADVLGDIEGRDRQTSDAE
jgi:hypothetical protein